MSRATRPGSTGSRSRRRLPRALAPFGSADYRVLAISMVASLFGAGMWAVAMVYEVMSLGGGPVELSLVGTSTAVGLVATALLGGVAADRLPRRLILRGVEGVNVVAVAGSALLSALGLIDVWHLAVTGALLGAAAGFYFPAYSAILPRILPAEQLLAANGIEGVGRPVLQYAAGPAAAGALVAAFSPGDAIGWIAACHLIAFVSLWWLHPRVDETEASLEGDEPASADAPEPAPRPRRRLGAALTETFRSLREGVVYTARTPWLRWTLLWAIVFVFVFIGPFEVLTPFVLRDRLHLGADAFAVVLAANGVGSAVGAIAISSRPMPRRYLTWMFMAWGPGILPIAVFGVGTELWMFAVASFVIGAGGGIGQVIWGTLLQRRVPPSMLGRVSSLDFFVSLALMPVSVAVTGPLALVVDASWIFVIVGIALAALSVLAWWLCGFAREEAAHPLTDDDADAADEA